MLTRLMSAIRMEVVAEPFIRRRAVRHLEKDRIVIFGAGTGNPYFTTDTAAALRAVEIEADVIIKGTRVDGVYDSDPERNPAAFKFTEISYLDVLRKDLKVMDMTAITLCKENKLPILVFNMNTPGNFRRLILGEAVGTKCWELSSPLAKNRERRNTMVKDILKEAEDKMHKAIEVVRQELVKIRTGKATTALLDGIKVDYYGTMTPLSHVRQRQRLGRPHAHDPAVRQGNAGPRPEGDSDGEPRAQSGRKTRTWSACPSRR